MSNASIHNPRNAKIKGPEKLGEIEIFWQTEAIDKIQKSFQQEKIIRTGARVHDLYFSDIAKLLTGYVVWIYDKSGIWIALSRYYGKIYQVVISISTRQDNKSTVFAVIKSCYICNKIEYVKEYQRLEKQKKENKKGK